MRAKIKRSWKFSQDRFKAAADIFCRALEQEIMVLRCFGNAGAAAHKQLPVKEFHSTLNRRCVDLPWKIHLFPVNWVLFAAPALISGRGTAIAEQANE